MNVNRGREKRDILPQGWRWVELAEVCDFVRGVTFDKAQMRTNPASGFTSVLRAGNIQDALNTCDDLIWVPEAMIDKEQYLRAGDVAICLSSGSASVVGKTAYCAEDTKSSVGAFCGILRARGALDNRYLSFWLRSKDYQAWRDLQARGTNIQNLRFSEISKIHLPVPRLSEQKRIAAILTEQMAAVEKARLAAEAQLEAAKALPGAYMRQIFPKEGQKLPPGWRWVRLSEVCELYQPETISLEQMLAEPGPYNVFGANGVIGTFGRFNHDDPELLVTCRGATCGTINMSVAKSWITGNSMVVKPLDAHQCEKSFLFWVLKGSDFSVAIAGTAQPQITRKTLSLIQIPLPPLSEQKGIAVVLSEQMASAERLRNEIEKQLHEINALPAALLRRAFSGEL